MKRTVKVLDVIDTIRLSCFLETDSETGDRTYRLVLFVPGKDRYGYRTEHRKTIAKYADMASVLCMVRDIYCYYIYDKPYDDIISWCAAYYGKRF